MIFLQIFLTFLKIGLFTFGGGYGMVALIQDEVVRRHGWMTLQEFADLLAVSQMTPGPIGINTATYAGYTAVLHAGYSPAAAAAGSLLASLAVIILPVTLMIALLHILNRYRNSKDIQNIFAALNITVIGLIAAAALSLVNAETFGTPGSNKQFVSSLIIFAVVFGLSIMPRKVSLAIARHDITLKRPSPIWLIMLSGLAGLLLYGWQ